MYIIFSKFITLNLINYIFCVTLRNLFNFFVVVYTFCIIFHFSFSYIYIVYMQMYIYYSCKIFIKTYNFNKKKFSDKFITVRIIISNNININTFNCIHICKYNNYNILSCVHIFQCPIYSTHNICLV